MRKGIALFGLIVFMIAVSACSKKATFGEGDIKFSVDLVDGNYELNNGVGNDVVVSGDLKLKLCNNGQKEIPFILEREYGGVFIEFKPEDKKNVKDFLLQEIEKIQITSDEGFINLIPDKCPTYPFSFRKAWGTDPTGEYGGLSKKAFQNADYYFFVGDKKFKLKGAKNIITDEQVKSGLAEKQKQVGLTDEQAKAILNKIAQDAPLDDCKEGADQASCLIAAWELAFRKGIPEGQEFLCDIVQSAEHQALCKSGVSKTLAEVQNNFNKYVNK